MDNRKRDYAIDKLKTVAIWPWIVYKRAVADYDNPYVEPRDWWEETMMGGMMCVAWVMMVIAALAVGIATCNCVFDHSVPADPVLLARDCGTE